MMVADAGPIPLPLLACLPLTGERTPSGMTLMVLNSRLLSDKSFIITWKENSISFTEANQDIVLRALSVERS